MNIDSMENGGKESFSYETKASIHVSQLGECAYGANSQNDERLLWESIIVSFYGWILILKVWWNENHFVWNQSININYPNEKNKFMVPNHNKIEDYYENLCLSYLTDEPW